MKARVVVTTQARSDPRRLAVSFHIPTATPGEPSGYGTLVLFHEPAAGPALEQEWGVATEHELETRQLAAAPAPAGDGKVGGMKWLGAPG